MESKVWLVFSHWCGVEGRNEVTCEWVSACPVCGDGSVCRLNKPMSMRAMTDSERDAYDAWIEAEIKSGTVAH